MYDIDQDGFITNGKLNTFSIWPGGKKIVRGFLSKRANIGISNPTIIGIGLNIDPLS